MTITVRTLAIVVVLVVGGAVAGGYLLLRGGSAPKPQATLAPGVPTVLTANQLRELADASPIFWAGELATRRIEVTATKDGTFVRYLPFATAVGGKRRALTVATYELAEAWSVAQRAAGTAGAKTRTLPDGRLAVWRPSSPTSVYLAQPGSDLLVEVFDPDATKARHLSLSGLIRPVAAP
jgi:hypothetical protein